MRVGMELSNIYDYQASAYVREYFFTFCYIGVLGISSIAALASSDNSSDNMWSGVALGMVTLIVVRWYLKSDFQHLSICCDDDGLSTLMTGKRRRTIAWLDVMRIERVRRPNLFTGACRNTFFVISAD